MVGVGLAILQQVTGINTVIYFAPTIIDYTGVDSSSAAILASVAVGVVNVGMTLVAIRLLDRAGRRPADARGQRPMAVSLFDPRPSSSSSAAAAPSARWSRSAA